MPDPTFHNQLETLLGQQRPSPYTLQSRGGWSYVTHTHAQLPAAGWKLHVAANGHTAPELFQRCIPLLLEHHITFKCLTDLRQTEKQNDWHANRAASGKFITVYPQTTGQALWLAEQLHAVTAGLQGPRIQSDRAYPGSGVVFYRYGGFSSLLGYNTDGLLEYYLRAPNGTLIPDQRLPWFAAPAHVTTDPFLDQSIVPPSSDMPDVHIGPYRIRRALKQSNKGGVYEAEDTRNGLRVVLKEARPGIQTAKDVSVQDALKIEAQILKDFAECSAIVKSIEKFEFAGHFFIVMEYIEGPNLSDYMLTNEAIPFENEQLWDFTDQLLRIVYAAHKQGIVLRDFTSNNLIVTPTGRLRLVDLGLATLTGKRPLYTDAGTKSFVNLWRESRDVAHPCDDLYALGATLYHLITRKQPLWPGQRGQGILNFQYLFEQLSAVAAEGLIDSRLIGLALTLLNSHEAVSPNLEQLLTFVHSYRQSLTVRVQRLSEQLTAQIIGGMQITPEVPLWGAASRHDPITLYHGNSGTLLPLFEQIASRPDLEPELQGAVRHLNGLYAAMPRQSRSLYFGTSGLAILNFTAARVFPDQEFLEQANALMDFELSPDMDFDLTHGLVGIGLTYLHAYQQTGGRAALRSAQDCFMQLLDTSTTEDGQRFWLKTNTTPHKVNVGLAHGSAGAAFFFLALYVQTRDPQVLDALAQIKQHIMRQRVPDLQTPTWQASSAGEGHFTTWCNGSLGLGVLHHHLYQVMGDPADLDVALGVLHHIVAHRYAQGTFQCHGLASVLDFACTLARHGHDTHAEVALLQAELWQREFHRVQSGEPDKSHYMVGSAGVLSALQRSLTLTPSVLAFENLFQTAQDTAPEPTPWRLH